MPRSLPLSWTTALVLLLPVAAWSQEAGQDAPTEQADAALTVSSDLRADYIQGEPIPVRLRVENPSGADASFPALDLRPHLVRFEVVTPKGDKQTWFNTPPAEDGDQRWTVRAGSHREVLLQVPSSQRFLAGDYRVTVRILDGEVEHELPEHRFTLAKADPAAGRAFSEPVGVERAGYHAAWVQRTGTGYELYLNVTDGKDPGKFVADHHLASLDRVVDPVLTHALPQDRFDRHVYWLDGDSTVRWVRLRGDVARAQPQAIQSPYPKIELLGRGGTDAEGGLHVPIWVPAPKGSAGEIRVITQREREGARFRSVVKLDRRPEWVDTTVDGAGNLRILVPAGDSLDMYTVAAGSELPGMGRRLLAPPEEGPATPPALARFGHLGEGDSDAGGLSVLVLVTTPEGLEGRWLNLSGAELGRLAPLQTSAELIDLLPKSRDDYGLLVRGDDGLSSYLGPGEPPRQLGRIDDQAALLLWQDHAVLRSPARGGPFVVKQLD
jgi:hypothetical protein